MVIKHFGGFATGSATLYGDCDDIAKNFVSKGIVVVVIQYRLGVHGMDASRNSSCLRGVFRPLPTPFIDFLERAYRISPIRTADRSIFRWVCMGRTVRVGRIIREGCFIFGTLNPTRFYCNKTAVQYAGHSTYSQLSQTALLTSRAPRFPHRARH